MKNKAFLSAFFLGIAVCSTYVLTPYLYSYFNIQKNYAWVPINSQYQVCSDDKFYASVVQEARKNFFSFHSPARSEVGSFWIDIFRAISVRTAATLTFFIPNEAIGFALSYLLGIFIHFGLIFILSTIIGLRPLQAMTTGILLIFWLKAISPHFDLQQIKSNLLDGNTIPYWGSLNDNFRYVVMHIAVWFSWLSLTALLLWNSKNSPKYYIGLILLLAALPYTYISVFLIAAFQFIFFTFILLFEKRKKEAATLIFLGLIALVLISTFGFWRHLSLSRNSYFPAVSEAHFFEPVRQVHLKDVLYLFYNKYCATLAAFTLLLYSFVPMRRILISNIFTVVALKLIAFFPHQITFSERLFIRGYDHVWFLLLIVCSFVIWNKIILYVPKHPVVRITLASLSYIFGFIIAASPTVAGVRSALPLFETQAFQIPQDQWKIYQYIKNHTPVNANVLALDVRDIELIPVYTHAHLYAASTNLTADPPHQEFARLMNGWKLVSIDTSLMKKWIETYIEKSQKDYCITSIQAKTTYSEAEGALTLAHIIYDPHVKFFNGYPIRSKNDLMKLSPEFIHETNRIMEAKPDFEDLNKVEYIVISKIYENRRKIPNEEIAGFTRIVNLPEWNLYKRTH